MRKFYVLLLCCVVPFMSGCTATNTLAKGITTKNLSGNGTYVDSHIGLNVETKIPELKTTFISGDFASTKAGTNSVSYREESSASIWNAKSVTKKRYLTITLIDDGNIPEAIKAVANVIRQAEKDNDAPKQNEAKINLDVK